MPDTPPLAPAGVAARRSPLHERHEALGASFTDFAGWEMPVRYSSELAEHRAVRDAAGLFDISHMAEFIVDGPGAADFLDHALSASLSPLALGRARYCLLLAEDGGILDDLIVYRLDRERFLVIANAGNRGVVADALRRRVGAHRVSVEDVSDRFALLALQGPASVVVLESVPEFADVPTPVADIPRYGAVRAIIGGDEVVVARTGYTGEDGFEILLPTEVAARMWEAILAAGAAHGVVPAGLAARDTLRLEAGMPLHGHEITPDTLPGPAGLGWSVALEKPDFIGRDAALAASADDPARVLVGLASEGRRAGRAGYAVVDPTTPDADPVGVITSGALSPTLGHPIALAYVDRRSAAPGTRLALDVRGTLVPATVTALPFYRRKK